jgi:hypothetical protein
MPPDDAPFAAMVLRHFAFLQQTYGFRVTESTESWVTFASHTCKVMVVLDRVDLFVDISSMEREPIRRLRFSLGQLLAVKGASGRPVELPPPESLDRRVEQAAQLLAHHGSEVLGGDWSIRALIIRVQTWQWLDLEYPRVMGTPDPHIRETRLQQLAFAYQRQNQEHQRDTWQCLDEWLRADDAERRAFAELVAARL